MKNLVKILGVRVTENLHSRLKIVSNSRGEDVSDFVRRAILKELAFLGYLSEDQKKALGLRKERQI